MGMNLAKKMIGEGYEVTIIDQLVSNIKDHFNILGKVKALNADYRKHDAMESLLKGCDCLFHFAYSTVPGSAFERIEDDVKENIAGSIGLFKAAVAAGVKMVVFPSSGGTVYGQSGTSSIKEDSPTDPICSYGITKLAIEKYLYLFHRLNGIDYVIYRISNPYGPGQDTAGRQGLVAGSIDRMLRSKKIDVFGDGSAVRDYIYIDDVTEALFQGLRKGVKNGVFNIGSGKGKSINEMISIIGEVSGTPPDINYLPERGVDVKYNVLDASKFSGLTGWAPSTGVKEGVKRTFNWIVENSK